MLAPIRVCDRKTYTERRPALPFQSSVSDDDSSETIACACCSCAFASVQSSARWAASPRFDVEQQAVVEHRHQTLGRC
jgi:hypothetical protein